MSHPPGDPQSAYPPPPRPLRSWLLKPDGSLVELLPESERARPVIPEQLAIPEFDPDPSVDEFHERIFTRWPVLDGSELVGYLFAESEPTTAEIARVLAGGS